MLHQTTHVTLKSEKPDSIPNAQFGCLEMKSGLEGSRSGDRKTRGLRKDGESLKKCRVVLNGIKPAHGDPVEFIGFGRARVDIVA
ncbi:MAG TPA: hypothetical protein VL135_14800 [Terracidiphilus sp.]|jgi:hypothetical protein|nr:hypothetical protein [Terracidiphilus sp.]